MRISVFTTTTSAGEQLALVQLQLVTLVAYEGYASRQVVRRGTGCVLEQVAQRAAVPARLLRFGFVVCVYLTRMWCSR